MSAKKPQSQNQHYIAQTIQKQISGGLPGLMHLCEFFPYPSTVAKKAHPTQPRDMFFAKNMWSRKTEQAFSRQEAVWPIIARALLRKHLPTEKEWRTVELLIDKMWLRHPSQTSDPRAAKERDRTGESTIQESLSAVVVTFRDEVFLPETPEGLLTGRFGTCDFEASATAVGDISLSTFEGVLLRAILPISRYSLVFFYSTSKAVAEAGCRSISYVEGDADLLVRVFKYCRSFTDRFLFRNESVAGIHRASLGTSTDRTVRVRGVHNVRYLGGNPQNISAEEQTKNLVYARMVGNLVTAAVPPRHPASQEWLLYRIQPWHRLNETTQSEYTLMGLPPRGTRSQQRVGDRVLSSPMKAPGPLASCYPGMLYSPKGTSEYWPLRLESL